MILFEFLAGFILFEWYMLFCIGDFVTPLVELAKILLLFYTTI